MRKAEADHQSAESLARESKPVHDTVCFHCQQSAEKYLKALVEELGLTIPKTHDLLEILNLLMPHHPHLGAFRRGLGFLTDFAVATRYPGENARKRQATAALRWEGEVRDACRSLLGVRPPGKKGKSP